MTMVECSCLYNDVARLNTLSGRALCREGNMFLCVLVWRGSMSPHIGPRSVLHLQSLFSHLGAASQARCLPAHTVERACAVWQCRAFCILSETRFRLRSRL